MKEHPEWSEEKRRARSLIEESDRETPISLREKRIKEIREKLKHPDNNVVSYDGTLYQSGGRSFKG